MNTTLVNEKTAAKQLGLTRRGLQNLRATGRGPRFVRISRNCIRYKASDLEDWVNERLAVSTSDLTDAERKINE